MRKRKYISGDWIARNRGEILPPREGRFLADGTEITRAEILPSEKRGVVEGTAKNGTQLQINVPLRSVLSF